MSAIPKGVYKIEMAEYSPVAASEKEDRGGWVRYGDDNLLPNYLIDLAASSPVHGALLRSISQMVSGKGIEGVDEATVEKLKLKQLCILSSQDEDIFGGYYWEIIYPLGGTDPVEINALPFENCRLSIVGDDDEVNGIWYSKDWGNIRKKKNIPVYIPLFDKEKAGEEKRQSYFKFSNARGSQYYGKPDYWPCVNYIELTRQMGMYHVNNIMNGLFPSFIINFFNGIPEGAVKEEITRAWENKLSGARNAGKFLMTFNEAQTTPPSITTFPITDADKQYEYLSKEATLQIMIGHRVTSPLLFGIRSEGGLGSNANELREAYAIFMSQVISPKQALIEEGMSEVLGVSGIKITEFSPFPDQTTPATPVQQKLKKKVKPEPVDMTTEDEKAWIEHLSAAGETIDLDEWELVDIRDAFNTIEEENADIDSIEVAFLASEESYANGDLKSIWGDAGLYKLRYSYSQNLSDDSREFCEEMVRLSKEGKVYRYEDIINMGDDGVNGSFAPAGTSNYSIFLYKGGVYCHHHWRRLIYFRKREKGKFLPNKGLDNDFRVGDNPYVKRKGKEAIAPIDMPNRGSLKYS